MSSVVISGDTSGAITLSAPAVAGTNTITLPASTGTVAVADGSGNLSVTGNLSFNSGYGSSAVGYGCRAWVSFVGSTGARYGSGNVSSVTRNGTGDYTVNFTTALVDANYANTVSVAPEYGAALLIANIDAGTTGLTESAPTTTSFRFVVAQYTGTRTDSKYISVAVFR